MHNPSIVFLNTHGVWIFVVFIFIYIYFFARQHEIAWHGMFSSVAALIISIVLKELFLVPRPFLTNGLEAQAGLVSFSSMPSAHAAIAFALSTSVALHNRRFGIFLFAISSIIGIGRVAANVHYPIDIAFGVLIGVLVGVFFDTVHFSKSRKLKNRP